MDGKGIALKPLPAQLIIKDFIEGEPDCNYEKYMVEFLNSSAWFRGKVGNKVFIWREKQDNGQCDAYAGSYDLDFKLFMTSTYGQARSEYSDRIANLPVGATVISSPNRTDTMRATLIFGALYDLRVEDLLSIERGHFGDKEEDQEVGRDIQGVIRYVCKKKNILFFLPYEFSSDNSDDLSCLIPIIREKLTHYFLSLFRIRRSRCPDKETYISCICCDTMLFFQFDNDHLSYIDSVSTSASKTYTKLQRYSIF